MSEKKRTALLAAATKDERLLELSQVLIANDWELIASRGTAEYLSQKGIAVKDVSEVIGEGPILNHKVVTLSQGIMAGLLVDRDDPDEMKEIENLKFPVIDLVYVDLYPLAEEIEKKEATPESVLKKTDIGGPALLRAAAKGGRYIIKRPDDIKNFCFWLGLGEPKPQIMVQFMRADAEAFVADYSAISANYWHSKLPTYRTLLSTRK